MQIAVKSFRLILARFQMNNLLDFSKLFFHRIYLDFTRGDVADALNKNMQELSALENQFNTLVMDTVNFLEDTQKAFKHADESAAQGIQSIGSILSVVTPIPLIPPHGAFYNPFTSVIQNINQPTPIIPPHGPFYNPFTSVIQNINQPTPIIPPHGPFYNPFTSVIQNINQPTPLVSPVYRPVNASACLDYLRINR